MKELKSKWKKAPRATKKAGETESSMKSCYCGCKCTDESAYTFPKDFASDNSSGGSRCACSHSPNNATLVYALNMA